MRTWGAKTSLGGVGHSTTCKSQSLWPGFWGPGCSWRFFFLRFHYRRRRRRLQLCRRLLAQVLLGSGVSRTLQAAPEVFIPGCSDVTEKGPYPGCVLASPLSLGRSCTLRPQPARCTIAATKPCAATCCGSLQTARAPNPILEGALARSPWSNCARWGPQVEAQMNQRGKEGSGKELQGSQHPKRAGRLP